MRQLLLSAAMGFGKLLNLPQVLRDRAAGHFKFNLEDYVADPFPVLKPLLAEKPIHRSYAMNGWLVLGQEEFSELMKHPSLTFSVETSPFGQSITHFMTGTDEFPLIDEPWMLNRDPPDHTRLRKLAAVGFTHRFITSQAPRIQRIFSELIDGQPDEFDFVAEIAQPLPAIVIAEMLGVPEADREKFQHWSEELLLLLDPSAVQNMNRSAVASIELRDYLAELVAAKRDARGDDLISELIAAEEDGDSLTPDEIYSNCALLLVAGHETTSRLLTTGLLMLLRNPDQMQMLRSGERAVTDLTEECLRYEPPVLGLFRFVKDDFHAFGCEFKQGQTISFSIAAANRDERIHQNPDVFDITREDKSHVSFGYGIHLCLGMPLTRLESSTVFDGMLERFPSIELVEEPPWGTHPIYRAPTELKIRVQR